MLSRMWAIAFLAVLVSSDSAAQKDKPIREVYQAQAMGQSTQLGKTFNVTINLHHLSHVVSSAFKGCDECSKEQSIDG